MDIKKEEFDSKIFKKDVFKLTIGEDISAQALKDVLNQIKRGVIYCFSIFTNNNINALLAEGFHFISIRSSYRYEGDFSLENISLPTGYTICANSNHVLTREKVNIDNLTTFMIKNRRFDRDTRIPKAIGKEIYKTWINNSFFNNYAEEYFYILFEEKVIGFITIKNKGRSAFIDLLGVDPTHQGKQLGKALVAKGLLYMKNREYKNIYVITEGENIAANRLYQKNDFVISAIELVFHKHID